MSDHTPTFVFLGSCLLPHLAALDASAIVAIGGAVATVIAAVSAAVLSWKAAAKAEAAAKISAESAAKVDNISTKADEIKVQVDGNLTKATNALAVANETNAGYQRLIAEMTLTKKDTQELALKMAESVPPPAPPATTQGKS